MTEVTSMAQIKPHERIACFEACHEYRHVRLRTAMRLYVHILGVIELFQPVPCDVLRDVHHLAATIVAVTGITLCVLVGQHTAHRLHHLVADEVLAGYQFNAFGLTFPLTADDVKNLCVSVHDSVFLLNFVQRYNKNSTYANIFEFFCRKIWLYQKFLVPLHRELIEGTPKGVPSRVTKWLERLTTSNHFKQHQTTSNNVKRAIKRMD